MSPLLAYCYIGLNTLHVTIGQREQARAESFTAIELDRAMGVTCWLP
jgi:hypothetical protein